MNCTKSVTWVAIFSLSILAVSCTKNNNTSATGGFNASRRTFRMGFMNSAPSIVFSKVLQSLDMWTQRSDATIVSLQVPWDSLYNGETVAQYVNYNFSWYPAYFRGKNMKIWVFVDPANGLNRATDANDLAALGKSIAQSGPQQVYVNFCRAMDSILQPDYMGLALETNAIRGLSPDSVYQGVVAAANSAATQIKAMDSHVKLGVSVQCDFAWGLLTGSRYAGVDKDFTDFPFIQALGISSYPYFVFNQASDIPGNYYSRLLQNHNVPVYISESGWSSQTVGTYTENAQKQADYILRQFQLLDSVNAIAYFQLTFTDINLYASGTASGLDPFAYIGIVDTNLNAKPALAAWDSIYHKTLKAGN